MSSFFRTAPFLASAALCTGVTANAQLLADSSPAVVSDSATIVAPTDYTGHIRYGDTGKPAAGVRVYFEIMHEGVNENTPIDSVTTDAEGVFRIPRFTFPLRRSDFISFEVDDPRNRYASEVLESCLYFDERLPGTDWTFPTLTQSGIISDEPYHDGVLRFVPRSTWQDKSSTFITLETGTFVSGTVTDAANGRPLSGIPVYTRGPHNCEDFGCLNDHRPADAYTTVTDAAGHYCLPVAPGQCELRVNHQALNGGDDDHKVTFIAVHGKTISADLALSPNEIARLKIEEGEMRERNKNKQERWDGFRVSHASVGLSNQ